MVRRVAGQIFNVTHANEETLPTALPNPANALSISDNPHLYLFETSKKPAPFNAQFILEAKAVGQRESQIEHSLSWSHAGLTITVETAETEIEFNRLSLNAQDGRVHSTKLFVIDEDGQVLGINFLQSQTPAILSEWQRKGLPLQETLSPIRQIIHHYNNGRVITEERLVLVAKLPKGQKLETLTPNALARTESDTAANTFLSEFDELYLHAHFGAVARHEAKRDFSSEALAQAGERIDEHREAVLHTPTYESPLMANLTGASQVLVKAEAEQNQGSFKVRGATNFLKAHIDEGVNPAQKSVVAASHGNHAQGVVLAANTLGFQNTILVLPLAQQTQKNKIRACLEKGALVFLYGNDPVLGSNLAAAMAKAKGIQADGLSAHLENVVFLPGSTPDTQIDELIARGQNVILYGDSHDSQMTAEQVENRARGIGNHPLFVPTYDHELIATGQSSVAIELISDHPELLDGQTTVIIPAGGGGLFAGMGAYFALANEDIAVVGANSELVPVISRSLLFGRLDLNQEEVAADEGKKNADGTDVPDAGKVTVEEVLRQKKALGNRAAVLVTEDEIAEAMVFADSQPWYNGHTQRIEGAAALTLAAALGGAAGDLKGKRIVLTVSGRNVDEADMTRLRSEKSWVIENPELYRFVCELRKTIRASSLDAKSAFEWIHSLSEMLNSQTDRQLLSTFAAAQISQKIKVSQVLGLILQRQPKLDEINRAVQRMVQQSPIISYDPLTGLMINQDNLLTFIKRLPTQQPLNFAEILSMADADDRLRCLTTLYLLKTYPIDPDKHNAGFIDLLNFQRLELLADIRTITQPDTTTNLQGLALKISQTAAQIFNVIETCNTCGDKATRAAIAGLLHDVRGAFQGLEYFPTTFSEDTTRQDKNFQYFLESATVLGEALSAPIYPFFNTPAVQDFVLSDFSQTAQKFTEKYSRQRGVTVSITEAAQTLKASADPALTRLVVQNLASNAGKYGQPPFEMGYDTNEESFYFKNEGVIPETALARLFDFGYRASNVGNKSGQGIGLANVKSYVERMGGNVSVTSDASSGTVFRIRLPLALDSVSPMASELYSQLKAGFTKQIALLSPENDAGLTQYLNDLLLFRRNRLSRLIQEKQAHGAEMSDAEISRLCEMIFADVPALLAAASPSYLTQLTPTHDELVTQASQIGTRLLPKNYADYGIQTDQPAKLDAAQIATFAQAGADLPDLVRFDWASLSNQFEVNDRGGLKKVSDGVHTWQDLLSLIKSVIQTKPQEALLFEIRQEEFPTLHPSPEFLAGLQTLVLDSNRTITLVIHGAAAKPSDVYTATRDGLIATPMGDELTAANAWLRSGIHNRLLASLTDRLDQKALQAFDAVHTEVPDADRATYLELVWQKLKELKGPNFRRTEIFPLIKDLRKKLSEATLSLLQDAKADLSPRERAELLAANPIDSALRAHPIQKHKGLYSIGAGQMLGVMEPARKLMDAGLLPLDYDLASNDLNEALTREINDDGTNRELLGKMPINPGDTIDIHVYNAFQKAELLLQGYDAVFLNLKGKFVAGAVDENLANIIRATRSILATPTKSYHNDGTSIVPYISIYKKLESMGYKDVADRFVVMAGFFEAKKLLAFRAGQDSDERATNRVDMSFIGADPEALVTLATVFSDTQIDELRRADTDWMKLKDIPNHKLAAFTLAGGANKNFLTYRAARLLMRDVFALSEQDLKFNNLGSTFGILNDTLNNHKEHNIHESDAFSAKLLASHGIHAYHLWSPEALKEDIRRCLPDHVVELIQIRLIADRILSTDVGKLNLDFFTETRTSDLAKYRGLDVTPANLDKAKQRLPKAIARSSGSAMDIRLAYLDELLELIRGDTLKKSGTRNSRDGLIDETIAYFYTKLTGKKAWGDAFREFRSNHYPVSWTGANAQEGRNGIGDAVNYVKENSIAVSPVIAESLALYQNSSPEELSQLEAELTHSQMRPYPDEARIIPDDPIHPRWGLEKGYIVNLFASVSSIIMGLRYNRLLEVDTTAAHLKEWMELILSVLGRVSIDKGQFKEVTEPLCELRYLIQSIHTRLSENHLDQNNIPRAIEALDEAFAVTLNNFKQNSTTYEIADNIRVLCQKFYWVDLYLQGLVGVEKTLINAEAHRKDEPVKRTQPNLTIPTTHYPVPSQPTRAALTTLMGGNDYQPALHAILDDHKAADRLQQHGASLMMGETNALSQHQTLAVGARNLSGTPLSAAQRHRPAAMMQHPSSPLARQVLPAHIQARSQSVTRSILVRR